MGLWSELKTFVPVSVPIVGIPMSLSPESETIWAGDALARWESLVPKFPPARGNKSFPGSFLTAYLSTFSGKMRSEDATVEQQPQLSVGFL
jgi:hypothetical protein